MRLVAWADTGGDGEPDREVGRSDRLTVRERGEWVHWEFTSDESALYVGWSWPPEPQGNTPFYWTTGELRGWSGLGSTLVFALDEAGPPTLRKAPRYTNLRVTWVPKAPGETRDAAVGPRAPNAARPAAAALRFGSLLGKAVTGTICRDEWFPDGGVLGGKWSQSPVS